MEFKQIKVVPYNDNWPKLFDIEAKNIERSLGDNFLKIYHIGSTSIPGMVAKPSIDIMAAVKDITGAVDTLQEVGYKYKGELNIPFRYFFSKKEGVDINLHVVESDHWFVKLNLAFREYLRNTPKAVLEYSKLKEDILVENNGYFKIIGGIFTEYTLKKHEFIQCILNEAGFDDINIVFCLHYRDWKEYHRIKNEQIISVINLIYDKNHPDYTAENHFHFVMYKGTQVIGIGHIEFLGEDEAALRGLAVDAPFQKQGFGAYMLRFLENWIKSNGRSVVRLHAALTAENFYRKLGYVDMEFNDISISPNVIDLGKLL